MLLDDLTKISNDKVKLGKLENEMEHYVKSAMQRTERLRLLHDQIEEF